MEKHDNPLTRGVSTIYPWYDGRSSLLAAHQWTSAWLFSVNLSKPKLGDTTGGSAGRRTTRRRGGAVPKGGIPTDRFAQETTVLRTF